MPSQKTLGTGLILRKCLHLSKLISYEASFPRPMRFLEADEGSDWDPTKWIIYILHKYTSLVPSLATTPNSSILKARSMVLRSQADRLAGSVPDSERPKSKEELPVWSKREAKRRNGEWVLELVGEEIRKRRMVLVLVQGCLVDVGGYVDEHVSYRFSGVQREEALNTGLDQM